MLIPSEIWNIALQATLQFDLYLKQMKPFAFANEICDYKANSISISNAYK